jgi:hypothetical protein
MRALLFVAVILAVTGAVSTPAQAQNYPWCAQYGGGDTGGGTNCGFTTFEQCLATLSGMGGFCNRNTQYVPPPGPHAAAVTQAPWRHHRRHPRF